MHKIYLLSLLLFLGLVSCQQQISQESKIDKVVLRQSTDVMPISSFASSVEYLELKIAQTNILLGDIEAVKQIGSDWIIKQRFAGRSSFLRFNQKGDFITELAESKVSEIIAPKDIIAYENGYAVLAQNGIHQLADDGKYMKKLVSGVPVGNRFFEEDGKFFILNEKYADQFIVEAGENISNQKGTNLLLDRVQRMVYTEVQNSGKEQLIYSALNDNLCRMVNDEPVKVLTFSGDGIPTFAKLVKAISKMDEKDALKYLRETEHVSIKRYLENTKYIYLDYWVGSHSSTAIIDKETGTTQYFDRTVNDIDGGIWERPQYLTEKNELVIPLTAYKIAGHEISNKKEKNFMRLQKQIADSNNLVLMFCKLM